MDEKPQDNLGQEDKNIDHENIWKLQETYLTVNGCKMYVKSGIMRASKSCITLDAVRLTIDRHCHVTIDTGNEQITIDKNSSPLKDIGHVTDSNDHVIDDGGHVTKSDGHVTEDNVHIGKDKVPEILKQTHKRRMKFRPKRNRIISDDSSDNDSAECDVQTKDDETPEILKQTHKRKMKLRQKRNRMINDEATSENVSAISDDQATDEETLKFMRTTIGYSQYKKRKRQTQFSDQIMCVDETVEDKVTTVNDNKAISDLANDDEIQENLSSRIRYTKIKKRMTHARVDNTVGNLDLAVGNDSSKCVVQEKKTAVNDDVQDKKVTVKEDQAKCDVQELEKEITVKDDLEKCDGQEKKAAVNDELAKCDFQDKEITVKEDPEKCDIQDKDKEETVIEDLEKSYIQVKEATVKEDLEKCDIQVKEITVKEEPAKSDIQDKETTVTEDPEKSDSQDKEAAVNNDNSGKNEVPEVRKLRRRRIKNEKLEQSHQDDSRRLYFGLDYTLAIKEDVQNMSDDDSMSDVSDINDDRNVETDDDDDSISDSSDEEDTADVPYGSLVWAEFSNPNSQWPGIVIRRKKAGLEKAKENNTWVMWFGDYLVSEVPKNSMKCFALAFHENFSIDMPKKERAVTEALQVCADRLGIKLEGYHRLKEWAQKIHENGQQKQKNYHGDPFPPTRGSVYPDEVLNVMESMRNEAEENRNKPPSDTENDVKPEPKETGEKSLCLACNIEKFNTVERHPLFEGFVCLECLCLLKERLLKPSKYGFFKYCAVCCQGDAVYVCGEKECGRTFCSKCIKRHLSSWAITQIKSHKLWKCLLCADYTRETHGSLQPMHNWQERLVRFYNPDSVRPEVPSDFTGRPIRVLSLYDGISAVKHVLDCLGLDVEVYYYAESDIGARRVSKKHDRKCDYSHSIGTVERLSKAKLRRICPIDLVVACPPDVDRDVDDINKSCRGLEDRTCSYMMRIKSVLRNLEQLTPGRRVYWLLETSATMFDECRLSTNNFFKLQHCMWDAQLVSPYVRPRLYWGNIPELYHAVQYYVENKMSKSTMKRFLDPRRKPRVYTLRSCAIDYQPPETCEGEPQWRTLIDDTLYQIPVKEGRDEVVIRVEEVEKILGLPENYTYMKLNSLETRQSLLKKAPSVFMLKHLLKPLTKMFLMKRLE